MKKIVKKVFFLLYYHQKTFSRAQLMQAGHVSEEQGKEYAKNIEQAADIEEKYPPYF